VFFVCPSILPHRRCRLTLGLVKAWSFNSHRMKYIPYTVWLEFLRFVPLHRKVTVYGPPLSGNCNMCPYDLYYSIWTISVLPMKVNSGWGNIPSSLVGSCTLGHIVVPLPPMWLDKSGYHCRLRPRRIPPECHCPAAIVKIALLLKYPLSSVCGTFAFISVCSFELGYHDQFRDAYETR
jgi:hypothetical protein